MQFLPAFWMLEDMNWVQILQWPLYVPIGLLLMKIIEEISKKVIKNN